ncbi:MAG: bifunctional alpha,alpha-trehalose-phosphate synthase (UDP-forming)/trehalose-phosphatase [Solirubrobacterales bacterium]
MIILGKIIIISNRLPITVNNGEAGIEYKESIGGLSTGLKSYHKKADSLWVGWPGITNEEINSQEQENIEDVLKQHYKCIPVFLSEDEIDQYYLGFSNKTIWPLFHYFASKTEYNFENWDAYKRVNEKFFKGVEKYIQDGDIVWVHDYQLMLLPRMIKEKYPNTQVGFFLHIPFPSIETFRLLIWREEILYGLLGADLIGFHTYDYVRHFLSSTRRLLGLEDNFNKINYKDRFVRVDAFPMGIDYFHFSDSKHDKNSPEVIRSIENESGTKMILSVDRLDYTKGIPERIKAFSRFLSTYPEYLGKVRLNLIVAPSREVIDSYDELLSKIKELVSEINGKYGTINWMPVWFYYRTLSQKNMIAFYRHSDVLLVTPLRDGMNLIAKEYIAARTDFEGMLVISETAGAASELAEAVIVNANDFNAIAYGLKQALDMPREEKIARNKIMNRRIMRYNVYFWADEFINALKKTAAGQANTIFQVNINRDHCNLESAYKNSKRRVLFLDYDGTLVGFTARPELATPDNELKELLKKLAEDPKNLVCITSGRDRGILNDWLGEIKNLYISASHGLWFHYPDQEEWAITMNLDNKWKDSIRPVLELYTDRMPRSFIEEKDYSLALHYRQCDPDMVDVKLREVKDTLVSMTESSTLIVQEGNKVIEIKDSRFNKGFLASMIINKQDFDFILGAGDDTTDEDLFSSLPEGAYSIKVGYGNTCARYRLESWKSMRMLLKKFADISSGEEK